MQKLLEEKDAQNNDLFLGQSMNAFTFKHKAIVLVLNKINSSFFFKTVTDIL